MLEVTVKLATVRYQGHVQVGVVEGDRLALLPRDAGDILNVLSRPDVMKPVATVDFEAVRFLPPIVRPSKLLCLGVNYRDHAEEAARNLPEHPSVFPRFADSIVGHGEPVIAPAVSAKFDYEGELAVIIGKPCWRIQAEEASGNIAGYSCFADNSARDFQFHSQQVTAGKNFYASGAFGPWLATPDELGPLASVGILSRLNGKIMQRASLGDLIYDIPTIIAYISQFTPLRPGDVIATGTPSGVGALQVPPVWIKPGDRFEVEITGVGLLSNPVAPDGPGASPFAREAEFC